MALKPELMGKEDEAEEKKAAGDGWFGQSLKDGVYEEEDDEEELGELREADER